MSKEQELVERIDGFLATSEVLTTSQIDQKFHEMLRECQKIGTIDSDYLETAINALRNNPIYQKEYKSDHTIRGPYGTRPVYDKKLRTEELIKVFREYYK